MIYLESEEKPPLCERYAVAVIRVASLFMRSYFVMFLSTFLSTACRVLPALVVELLMFASATVWAIQSYAPSWSGRIRGPVAASR